MRTVPFLDKRRSFFVVSEKMSTDQQCRESPDTLVRHRREFLCDRNPRNSSKTPRRSLSLTGTKNNIDSLQWSDHIFRQISNGKTAQSMPICPRHPDRVRRLYTPSCRQLDRYDACRWWGEDELFINCYQRRIRPASTLPSMRDLLAGNRSKSRFVRAMCWSRIEEISKKKEEEEEERTRRRRWQVATCHTYPTINSMKMRGKKRSVTCFSLSLCRSLLLDSCCSFPSVVHD